MPSWALQWRGSHEVLDRAAQLCRSFCVMERRTGADILGQLGVPDRTFPERCLQILLGMLECEQDHGVLQSIVVAPIPPAIIRGHRAGPAVP